MKYEIVIEEVITSKTLEVCEYIKDGYIKENNGKKWVFIPLHHNKKCVITKKGNKKIQNIFDMFQKVKKDAEISLKTGNVNMIKLPFETKFKYEAIIMYRYADFYWNYLKYLVFVYQNEKHRGYELTILRRYIEELKYLPLPQELNLELIRLTKEQMREFLKEKYLEEFKQITKTNRVNITL